VPNILQAIAAITADLGKIAKDGKGPQAQGSFPFMPVESIVERLQPLLVEHGVILRENVLEVIRETDEAIKATPNGDPIYDGRVPTIRVRVQAKIEWTWVQIDDDSGFSIVNYGEAHDVADKAIRKANTAAYKEMLLRTFSIVAGEKDPDSIDPNEEQEAVQERRNRGQQKVDNARPTAGRTRARATPKVPAPEPEQAAPAEAAVESAKADATPAEPVGTVPAERPQPEPASTATREQQTPAEQRSADWAPDPDDVAYAEQQAPAPAAPAATATEKRGENISALKNDLRRAWSARGMNREDVNALGRKLTGKEPSAFLFNATDLKRLMAAVESGEMA
jgi:hypothetical protein